jgi:hypothetical protein
VIKAALHILRELRSEFIHYGCLGDPLGLWPSYTVATSSVMALRMISSKRKRTADSQSAVLYHFSWWSGPYGVTLSGHGSLSAVVSMPPPRNFAGEVRRVLDASGPFVPGN